MTIYLFIVCSVIPGQSHLRSEDRFRHITSERTRVPTVYPIKRKRSHDRGLTLEERWVHSTFWSLFIRSEGYLEVDNLTCWNVLGENAHLTGAVAGKLCKLQRQHRSTHRRAPLPPGVPQPAPSALQQHTRTTHRSWTSQSRSSRNLERRQIVWRRRQKARLVPQYR